MSFFEIRVSLLFIFGILSLILIFYLSPQNPDPKFSSVTNIGNMNLKLKIKIFDLPDTFNYGLLDLYWSMSSVDSRINSDPDAFLRAKIRYQNRNIEKPYPSNPLIKQYSAEYWILKDLEKRRAGSAKVSDFYEVVGENEEFDVVFVPFFATLSAEIELGWGKKKGGFLKKDEGQNGDYKRQKEVVKRVMKSEDWRRSGGRDHIFVLTGTCVKMPRKMIFHNPSLSPTPPPLKHLGDLIHNEKVVVKLKRSLRKCQQEKPKQLSLATKSSLARSHSRLLSRIDENHKKTHKKLDKIKDFMNQIWNKFSCSFSTTASIPRPLPPHPEPQQQQQSENVQQDQQSNQPEHVYQSEPSYFPDYGQASSSNPYAQYNPFAWSSSEEYVEETNEEFRW